MNTQATNTNTKHKETNNVLSSQRYGELRPQDSGQGE